VTAIAGKRCAKKRRSLYHNKIIRSQAQFFFIGSSEPVIIFAKIAKSLIICSGTFFTCRAFGTGPPVKHQAVRKAYFVDLFTAMAVQMQKILFYTFDHGFRPPLRVMDLR
jgi:hypothetical protein